MASHFGFHKLLDEALVWLPVRRFGFQSLHNGLQIRSDTLSILVRIPQAEVLELEEERNILDKVVPGDLRTLFQCACPETPTGEGHTDTIKHHTKAPNPPPKKKGSAFPSS